MVMKKKNEDGFTLLELIVAMTIGVVLIAAIGQTIVYQAQLNNQARNTALSSSFAENRLEALRSAGYTSLTNGTIDISSELPTDLTPTKSAEQTITDQSSGLKKVEITVTYNNKGVPKTSTYTTFIGELGVGQY